MRHYLKRVCGLLAVLLAMLPLCAMAEMPGPIPGMIDEKAEIIVTGETDLPGRFFLSFPFSRNLMVLDGKGKIVWEKYEPFASPDQPGAFWDFKQHVVDGEVYYSYHDNTGTYDNYGLTGYGPGERVILDKDFNEIKRITFEESGVTPKGFPLDGHDFLLIDLNHYILNGYIKDTVYNIPGYEDGSDVVFSYLQEVKDGEVVWEWKSIDYPELYGLITIDSYSQTGANDFANEKVAAPDYIHFNSMDLDADGNLICSFRHIHSILCLDRSASENQIKWTLSGVADEFGLSPIQKCSAQHTAFVDGNYITVFDNGNRNGASRVVGYCVDTDNKELKAFRSYTLGGKYSEACGSAQHIDGEVYVIGWGMSMGDPEAMSVVDFATGETLMSVSLKNPMNATYRCLYFEPVESDSLDVYLASAKEEADAIRASLENDPMTQLDMNMKSEELREIWDAALIRALDEAKAALPEAEWNALTDAQNAWTASTEKAIEAAGKDFEGGSMYALIVNMEAASLTEARVYEICEMLK